MRWAAEYNDWLSNNSPYHTAEEISPPTVRAPPPPVGTVSPDPREVMQMQLLQKLWGSQVGGGEGVPEVGSDSEESSSQEANLYAGFPARRSKSRGTASKAQKPITQPSNTATETGAEALLCKMMKDLMKSKRSGRKRKKKHKKSKENEQGTYNELQSFCFPTLMLSATRFLFFSRENMVSIYLEAPHV